jgi:hypothetical protein
VRSVLGTPTVGQLTLGTVTRGQILLVQFGVVLFRFRLGDRSAFQLGRLERAELELVVEVQRGRTVLMIRFEGAAQVELLAADRIGVQTVGFLTFEHFVLIRIQLFVRVSGFRLVRLRRSLRCDRR